MDRQFPHNWEGVPRWVDYKKRDGTGRANW